MKYKVLRKLVAARQWASTREDEDAIILTLDILTGLFVIDVTLLTIGMLW